MYLRAGNKAKNLLPSCAKICLTFCEGVFLNIDVWLVRKYYSNMYCNKRQWLKQLALGDCNCAIAVTEGLSFLTQRLE